MMPVLLAVFIGTPTIQIVNSYFVAMLYKDMHVDFLSLFCNSKHSQRSLKDKIQIFVCVTCCSIFTSYHCSVFISDLHDRTSVVWLTSRNCHAQSYNPHSCFSVLNIVGRARWLCSVFLSSFFYTIVQPLERTNRKQTLVLISFPHNHSNWIGLMLYQN